MNPDENLLGDTEATVARLFAEILGTPSVPRTSSFFDLGGDSPSAAVACARLEQATGVRVSFSQLFRTPTVAQLTAWIDAARHEHNGDASALVAITPMQAAVVPTEIVSEVAWWFDGAIDDAALASAASDIHRRHQALHARYLTGSDLGLAELPAEPGQAQFHLLPAEDSDAATTDALWQALRKPLQLGVGEVWRCAIARSGSSGRTLFGIAAHHAGFDGQSLDILTKELSAAYSARAAGITPTWPERVASLAEMAADYRRQLAGQDLDAQRRHWRNEFSELPPCRFPGRNDAPVPFSGPASAPAFAVPNAQLRAWEDYGRANGMPTSAGMAAAFAEAISRAGGPRDIGLMVPYVNQSTEVIARSITNRMGIICLRPNSPSRSGPNILARMQDSYRQAMAARDVFLDPKEVGQIVSDKESNAVVLGGTPYLLYNTVPTLTLGSVVGAIAPEQLGWSASNVDLMLEVVPGSEGLRLHMIVRTDIYEASLADRLSQHFIDIVGNGPERLALETAN